MDSSPAASGRLLLLGMKAVLFDVRDVVPEIDRTRQAAEGHEGQKGAQEGLRLEEMLREKKGREDEEILRPLVRPQRADER